MSCPVECVHRVCVIDQILPHSPADYVRRPLVPPEPPTLGLSHLQFEAMITTARLSANINDFAMVVMLGLLGLRASPALAANDMFAVMSDTPLSDVMAAHVQAQNPATYEQFVTLFRTSTIGVVASGKPVQDEQGRFMSDGTLGVGRTDYGDGQWRILTFADPEAFARNYGPQFNAGVSGEVLLRMAAGDPECQGILVNSAIQEDSVIISKATATALVHNSAVPPRPRKSWWNRLRSSGV